MTCEKKAFPTRKAALKFGRLASFATKWRAYLCDECHCWHLTKQDAQADMTHRRPKYKRRPFRYRAAQD